MSRTNFLVTGASGHLGRRVVELLLERNAGHVIATTRKPDALAELAARGVEVREADFEDESGLARAFTGADRALLVSTDAMDRPGRRLAQHEAAIRAFVDAGVKHLAYTSLPNPVGSKVSIAADHAGTEAAIAASGLDHTILRNSLYADYLPMTLAPAIARGRLIDARENGAVAWVTREDCARAAAGALLAAEPGKRVTLDVTGPEALTSAQLASLAGEITGRTLVHESITPAALVEHLVGVGIPKPMAEVMASFDVGIARGELAAVTDTVERLGGRAPQSVRSVLLAHMKVGTALG